MTMLNKRAMLGEGTMLGGGSILREEDAITVARLMTVDWRYFLWKTRLIMRGPILSEKNAIPLYHAVIVGKPL